MAIASIFAFVFLSHLALIYSTDDDIKSLPTCPQSFVCANHTPVRFPFTNTTFGRCGIVIDCDHPVPKVQLGNNHRYDVIGTSDKFLEIHDPEVEYHISHNRCDDTFKNLTLPYFPFVSFTIPPNLTFFKCNNTPQTEYTSYNNCTEGYSIYYKDLENDDHEPAPAPAPDSLLRECSTIQLPISLWPNSPKPRDLFSILNATFALELHITQDCLDCQSRGAQCLNIHQEFQCHAKAKGKRKRNYGLIIGAAISAVVVILAFIFIIFITWRRFKWKYVPTYFLSRNTSDPSSRADLEGSSIFFGVPVFSYTELEEATNNFDPNQELGDGGFGTVYHGKLRDGREVAVKRLYEHNYKRVEQFKNEIEILTRLRHHNLVTLYGCTSRHSRELLLVYEYIPNGTVADHLHGDQAKSGPLPWSIRMNIAIETATALAYLHASDIIHRDVKTNNILLDNNFCVKVADFGLSRLFPTDVTHVSTAPQGTPGYVDPEYHQCYQLTDKSDVYSFGVVLIELISSLQAVDIGRHRHEINLAKLAVNKIQKCAFNELIDLSLGFESDSEVQRMTTSVAELAFRCLQFEREMRPTMDDVLETLMEIQGQDCKGEETEKVIDNVGVLKGRQPPPSPESDEVVLLKSKELPPSPVSVTGSWISRSTASNTSVS